ncbi:hypothetical protein LCGC14_2849480 [marine sediment metagenome]|uniref:Uncharacterized protein n=1 Tax=marine sediment metagenome TaxID=412755 RepID=A0A0F9AZQ5_9ZZZZ
MLSEGWKKGKRCRILSDIGKELNDDRVGTVINVDGAYILIELDKSKAHVERYPNEITEIWSVEDED